MKTDYGVLLRLKMSLLFILGFVLIAYNNCSPGMEAIGKSSDSVSDSMVKEPISGNTGVESDKDFQIANAASGSSNGNNLHLFFYGQNHSSRQFSWGGSVLTNYLDFDTNENLTESISGSPVDGYVANVFGGNCDIGQETDENPEASPIQERLEKLTRAANSLSGKTHKQIIPRIFLNRLIGRLEKLTRAANSLSGKTHKQIIPRIFLNRLIGVCEKAQGCKDTPELQKIRCMDVFDQQGALSDFYARLDGAIEIAKASGVPHIFIDTEPYTDHKAYEMEKLVIEQRKVNLDYKEKRIKERLNVIADTISKKFHSYYEEKGEPLNIWLTLSSLQFNSTHSPDSDPIGYLMRAILEKATKNSERKIRRFRLIDGAEVSVWYGHYSVEHSNSRLKAQQDELNWALQAYPNHFKLGSTISLWNNFEEDVPGVPMSVGRNNCDGYYHPSNPDQLKAWANEALRFRLCNFLNNGEQWTTQKRVYLHPILKNMFKKRDYIWIYQMTRLTEDRKAYYLDTDAGAPETKLFRRTLAAAKADAFHLRFRTGLSSKTSVMNEGGRVSKTPFSAGAVSPPGADNKYGNNALIMDAGSFVEFPTATNLNAKQGTMAFWFQPLMWNKGSISDGKRHVLFSTACVANKRSCIRLEKLSSSATLQLKIYDSEMREDIFINADISSWALSEWYFVAATWDENSGELALYINGKKVASKEISQWSIESTGTRMTVGNLYGNSLFPGIGRLDEFSLYNTALDEDAISGIYEIYFTK